MKWSDKEVLSWAKNYNRPKASLMILEDKIGIPHATLWWCFTHRLKGIDYDLFIIVNEKLKRRWIKHE